MKTHLTTIAAIFSYFVLYAPQPLLPVFAEDYSISVATAGALMTATLIPLALAPLLYGYLLSAVSPTFLLKFALSTMGLSCLAFAHSDSYHFAFAIRLLQGILLPAALTAITTHISAHSLSSELQRNMSLFITGTILGGLFGRILAGVFATYWSWQVFYYGLAGALLLTAFVLPKSNESVKTRYAVLHISSVIQAFKTPGVTKLYLSVFCLFFSFVALLNYLPFMVKTMLGEASEMLLGFMYCGFIMGAVTSLNAQRLIRVFGEPKRVMLLGYICFLIAISLLFIQQASITFMVLFLFCGSMFLVHSVAAAEVNHRSQENKSIVNALYVTFYYSGGVLGSYLPGVLYQHYGHTSLLISLLTVSGLGFVILLFLRGTKVAD